MSHFATVLFLLSSGLFGMLFVVPYREIGSRYHRLITAFSLIGWTFVWLLIDTDLSGGRWAFALTLGLMVGGILHWAALRADHDRARRLSYWLTWGLMIGMFVTLAVWPPHPEIIEYHSSVPLLLVHLLLSAAILGAIVDAMICGHWYLIQHGMGLGPIRRISLALAAVLLLKFILIAAQLGWYSLSRPALFERVVVDFPVLFWVRIGVGIGGGLLFNWMSWQALKHNNPQASTGILYACIVWILLGEFSAFYLMTSTGVAL